MDISTLTEAFNAAVEDLEKFSKEYDELAEDAEEDTIATSKANLDDALARCEATRDALDHAESVQTARDKFQKVELAKEDTTKNGDLNVKVDEPDMYEKKSGRFLADLYSAQLKGDPLAADRIAKHQAYEVEKYAIATGTLGGIIPPQYMVDLYAKAQRFGRVFADQTNRQALPEQGMSVIIPRLTTGLATAVQQTESSAVTTQDVVETDLSVPVRTIAGYSPVSRQTLERAQYSEAILMEDLIARYNAALDTQCISGSGSAGQHLGLLNVSGISTATIASFTAANAWAAVVGESGAATAINSWAATTGSPADKIVMHPRRWGAFLGLLDGNNRPLVVPNADGFNTYGGGDVAGYGPVGSLGGIPVFTDANVPTNLGGSTNQDAIIVMASPAVLLWERNDDPVTLAFEQQAGTSLQVQLVCYGYSAFTAGRYPAASAAITGAGLT